MSYSAEPFSFVLTRLFLMDIQEDHLNTISLPLCIFVEDVRAVALFLFHKKDVEKRPFNVRFGMKRFFGAQAWLAVNDPLSAAFRITFRSDLACLVYFDGAPSCPYSPQ